MEDYFTGEGVYWDRGEGKGVAAVRLEELFRILWIREGKSHGCRDRKDLAWLVVRVYIDCQDVIK